LGGKLRVIAAAALHAALALGIGQTDQDEVLDLAAFDIQAPRHLPDQREGIVGIGDV